MNTYDQNPRQPKVNRSAAPLPNEDKKYVAFKDAAWPVIGADIAQIIMEGKLIIPVRLTYKQILLLDEEVITPRGNFPSPNQERLAYPVEWANFITSFYKMPQWAYRSHTMGTIIDLLRSYHFINGWLTFRPGGLKAPTNETVVQPPQPPQEVSSWLK